MRKSLRIRLQEAVVVDDKGCWIWQKCRDGKGYGMLGVTAEGVTRMRRAHRLSYTEFVGVIPDGLQIDHLCRVTSCVNPAHLEPVTAKENTNRGRVGEHQRVKTHCPRQHPLSGDNLVKRKGSIRRECRICNLAQSREWKRRKRHAVD